MWDLAPLSAPALGRITVEHGRGGHALLRLVGDIDAATINAYGQRAQGTSLISAIDLTEVEFLSSSAVSFVIRQTRPFRERGHLPVMRGMSPRARRVLELTGAMTMFRSVAQATGTQPFCSASA